MDVYGDLTVQLNGTSMLRFIQEVEVVGTPGWKRDPELESNVNSGAAARDPEQQQYCFAFDPVTANAPFPKANLWIIRSGDKAYVTNIVPYGGQLSYDEYNGILKRFHDDLAGPAAGALGITAELIADDRRAHD